MHGTSERKPIKAENALASLWDARHGFAPVLATPP